ncbi:UDP-N-acetylglucosamine 2-epimerase, partial [Streptomyces sp. 24-1644]|uniref:UDP-N-acetylglucosamine 2-epimerase n=1 Tax=Streptomyces sp. 24-1644 TaxID=3457315 RepID=UPI003FA792CF
ANEGLGHRAELAGDVMVDICLRIRDAVLAGEHPAPALPEGIDPSQPFLLATLHRPDNTDDPARLSAIVESLAALPLPVALLAHPRLTARAEHHGIDLAQGSVHVGRPLPYAGLIAAVLASSGVVTDSGGLQKEAYLLDRVCTTIRPETEWIETLEDGWNHLVPNPHEMDAAEWAALVTRPVPEAPHGAPYGDGTAAQRVVKLMEEAARRNG